MNENVENNIVEETGVDTKATIKTEGQTNVDMITRDEAQKMADSIVAKKLAKMPSKEELQKYNEWKESQKTEFDKQAETLQKLANLENEKLSFQRENALLKKGVNSNDLDYVLFKVSKMDGEFDTNLELFLQNNPKYLGQKEEVSKTTTTGVKVNTTTQVKEDGVISILKQKYPDRF